MEKELLEYLKGMEDRINSKLNAMDGSLNDMKREIADVKQEIAEFRKDATNRLIRLEESSHDAAEVIDLINDRVTNIERTSFTEDVLFSITPSYSSVKKK